MSIHGIRTNAFLAVENKELYTKGYVWRCATCGVEKNGRTLDGNHRSLRLGGADKPAIRMHVTVKIPTTRGMPVAGFDRPVPVDRLD